MCAQEAAGLLAGGAAPDSSCATKAIGYRQAMQYLAACVDAPADGGGAPSEAGLLQAVRDVQGASRQLCTKQVSWFRDDAAFAWVDASGGQEAVVDAVLESWAHPQHKGERFERGWVWMGCPLRVWVLCGCVSARGRGREGPVDWPDLVWRRAPLSLAAGGCGTSGRLSPEEAQAMRRYQTRMRLLTPGSAALAGLLAEVTALVAGLRPGPEAAAEAEELAEPAGKRQRQ